MGLVRRSNSKFWYAQFQVDGRSYIRSTKTTDKKLAEQLLSKWKSEVVRAEYLGVKSRIRLSEAITNALKLKVSLKNYPFVVRHAKQVRHFLGSDPYLDQLSNRDVDRLHQELIHKGYASQTIKHILGWLKQTLSHASKSGYQVPSLIFPTIRLSNTRLRYLTIEEERRLVQSLDPFRVIPSRGPYESRGAAFNQSQHDHYDFIVMLLDTGARFSELATLRWDQVDFEQGSIRLWRSKVSNESVLFMTDRVKEVLQSRSLNRRSDVWVFTNSRGGHMAYRPKMFERIFKRAGLTGVTAHTLRHTHASRLIQAGMNLYEVKEVLGHSDIKTTMRYAHLERSTVTRRAKDVVNMLSKRPSQHSFDTTFQIPVDQKQKTLCQTEG